MKLFAEGCAVNEAPEQARPKTPMSKLVNELDTHLKSVCGKEALEPGLSEAEEKALEEALEARTAREEPPLMEKEREELCDALEMRRAKQHYASKKYFQTCVGEAYHTSGMKP